jgi:sarcosine oxidase subunit beta
MKERAKLVIIGGGVSGLGTAYQLAKRGFTDVVVIEKDYFGSGATGRCGGGIRQQFSEEYNIILARESVRMFEKLGDELGQDIGLRQGGYLILAHTKKEAEDLRNNVKLQNSLDVPSRYMDPEGALDIVPELNIEGMSGAAYCPTDGVAQPFLVVKAYVDKLKEMGVELYDHTSVTGIKAENGEIKKVMTDKGDIETGMVLNAAGAHSRDIAEMVGVEIPNKPYRHEIMATEHMKQWLKPMIISFHNGIYFSQSHDGEIVGGIGDPNEPSSYNIRSSLEFLERFTSVAVRYIPALRKVKVMRQWAGLYDVTPDARPILGPVDELPGFIQAHGYSGHGFMIHPMVTKLLAEYIIDGKTSIDIEPLNLRRYTSGEMIQEKNVVG